MRHKHNMFHAAGCSGERGLKRQAYFTDLRSKFPADALASRLLDENVPLWLPERLMRQAEDALQGLDRGMALEVARNIAEACTFGVRHYTGIDHIDKLLHSLYNKIIYCAGKKGIHSFPTYKTH